MNSLHCQQLVSTLAPTQQYRAQERPVHCPSCAWPSGKIQSRIPQAEDAWHTSLPCFKKKTPSRVQAGSRHWWSSSTQKTPKTVVKKALSLPTWCWLLSDGSFQAPSFEPGTGHPIPSHGLNQDLPPRRQATVSRLPQQLSQLAFFQLFSVGFSHHSWNSLWFFCGFLWFWYTNPTSKAPWRHCTAPAASLSLGFSVHRPNSIWQVGIPYTKFKSPGCT